MSRKMQSILAKAGIVVLVGVAIGVGAYYSNRNEEQNTNDSQTWAVSEQQSEQSDVTQDAVLDCNNTKPLVQESDPKATAASDTDPAPAQPKRPACTSGG